MDEVLAVGDAEFQKKAIGKMQDVSKGEGRTVLFVSHNMGAVEHLCKTSCIIKDGRIDFIGNVHEGIKLYLKDNFKLTDDVKQQIKLLSVHPFFELINIEVTQESDFVENYFTDKPVEVKFEYRIKQTTRALRVGFDIIMSSVGQTIFRSFHDDEYNKIEEINVGNYKSKCIIPANLFLEGEYVLNVAIGIHNVEWIVFDKIRIPLNYYNTRGVNKQYVSDYRPGVVAPYLKWETINL